MIPLGHKQNDEISNEGIDTVTGLRATTGGPNASGNPVVPTDHPAAVKAMKKNKTGPFAVVHGIIDSIKDKIEKVKAEQPELPESDDKATKVITGSTAAANPVVAPTTVVNPPSAPINAAPTLETKPTT